MFVCLFIFSMHGFPFPFCELSPRIFAYTHIRCVGMRGIESVDDFTNDWLQFSPFGEHTMNYAHDRTSSYAIFVGIRSLVRQSEGKQFVFELGVLVFNLFYSKTGN